MKQIHHSTHPVVSYGSFFSRRSWLEATHIEGLTESVSYETLSSSKQLLNDVSLFGSLVTSIHISHNEKFT